MNRPSQGVRANTAQDVLYQLNLQSTQPPIQAQNGLQIPAGMAESASFTDNLGGSSVAIEDTWGAAPYCATVVGSA